MFSLWLYQIPLWELALLIIGCCVAYTVAGLVVVRRWVHSLPESENEAAGYLLSIAGVAYAVLLAMIAVGAWEGVNDVESAVQREANALASIYRNVEAYEPAQRDRFREMVGEYVHFVVNDEWPALRLGRRSPRTELAGRRLSGALTAYVPGTSQAQLVYPLVLDQVTAFTDARRMRLLTGTDGLDGVTWFVVILGGMVTVGFSFFLRTRTLAVHVLLSSFASSILGLLIFLIVAMDHPLWGDISVDPAPFREVLLEAGAAEPVAAAGLPGG